MGTVVSTGLVLNTVGLTAAVATVRSSSCMRSSTGHCSATISRVRSLLVVYATFFAGIVAAGSVSAQDTTGTGALSGTIRDAARAPVAFATICLSQTTTCADADERGAFRIPNIRPGTYALEAAAPGAAALPLGRVDVRAGIDQRLDVTLPSRESSKRQSL